MLKTNNTIKTIAFTAIFALLMVPTLTHADNTGSYGSDSYDGGGMTDWGGDSSGYDYSPNYSYDSGSSYDSSPSYGGSSYDSYTPSYGGSSYGSSYTPSYGGSSYGSSYIPSYGSSYSGSSIPSSTSNLNTNKNSNKSTNKNSNKSTNTNTNTSSSNSTSSSSAVAVNNNVNNVYVYTNPSGNAVVYNPAHQVLDGYCSIVPSNPTVDQVVTATAYATGGVGSYTYTWGGDIYSASGASTSFTSHTTGTKSITVTIRSDQEVITKTCNVTFQNTNQNNNISASCYATPTAAAINELVVWRVNVNGGNGNYTYNWSGTDGLSGNNNYVTKQYGYAGSKNGSVTVVNNDGQSTTANCSMNVNNTNSSYTGSFVNSGTPVSGVFVQKVSSGTPTSGVYLSQLPATGLSLTFVDYMIASMIAILALVATFVTMAKKRLIAENE
jgi:hypothetical protein